MLEFFRKNPRAAETLRGPMFEDKVVDFILELAKVDGAAGHPGGTGQGARDAAAEATPARRRSSRHA